MPLIEIVEPLSEHKNVDIKKQALGLLLGAYKSTNNMLKVAETQGKIDDLSKSV